MQGSCDDVRIRQWTCSSGKVCVITTHTTHLPISSVRCHYGCSRGEGPRLIENGPLSQSHPHHSRPHLGSLENPETTWRCEGVQDYTWEQIFNIFTWMPFCCHTSCKQLFMSWSYMNWPASSCLLTSSSSESGKFAMGTKPVPQTCIMQISQGRVPKTNPKTNKQHTCIQQSRQKFYSIVWHIVGMCLRSISSKNLQKFHHVIMRISLDTGPGLSSKDGPEHLHQLPQKQYFFYVFFHWELLKQLSRDHPTKSPAIWGHRLERSLLSAQACKQEPSNSKTVQITLTN